MRRLLPLKIAFLGARAAVLAACCAILAACQTGPTFYGYSGGDYGETSALSDYLAAQQARMNNDTQLAADYYLAALEAQPVNSLVLRDRAYQLLISDGRFKEARGLAPELSRGSLSYNLSRMVRVLELLKARKYDDANKALESVSGTGFDLLLKPITAAWAHAGKGDEAAAFKALDALTRHRAFSGFYVEHTAYMHAYFGNWEKARNVFEAGLEKGGALSSRAILDFAGRLSKRGAFDDAVLAVEAVLKQAPQITELIAARDQLKQREAFAPYVRRPSDAVAEALYRTATELVRRPTATSAILYARLATYLQPKLDAASVLIADVYAAQGRLAPALQTIETLDARGPMASLRVLRAANYLDRLERPEEATVQLQEALENNPDNSLLQISLADLLRRSERFDEAVALYDAAIEEAKEDDWTLFYGRGIALEQSGRFERGEDDLRKALALRPGDPFILNYLGYSLLDRGLKTQEAMGMIEAAVKARPNDGYIIDSQGWALYHLGEYEQAVTLLERAVSLQPGDPTINDHLGDAYWKAGRYIEARFKWQQVLTMEPTDTQVTAVEQKLDLGLTLAEASQNALQ